MYTVREISDSGYGRYLRQDATERAYWEGRGSVELGLFGQEIQDAGMVRALEGKHPQTAEKLRARGKHNKHLSDGRVLRGRSMYDVVLSPPKSVSVMRLFDADRLEAAHRMGVDYIAAGLERYARVKAQKGGSYESRETGRLVYGRWEHQVSRSLDPLRHTHLSIVNMTYDPAENRWKALQAGPLFKYGEQWTRLYGQVVRNAVEAQGYKTYAAGKSWEIAGVPESALVKYSARSAEVELAREGFREHHGRDPRWLEKGVLVRNHRPEKQVVKDWEGWREEQLNRLTNGEREIIIRAKDMALEHSYVIDMREWKGSYPAQLSEQKALPGSDSLVPAGRGIDGGAVGGKVNEEQLDRAIRFAFRDHVTGEAAAQWKEEETPRKRRGYRV